MAQSIEKNVQQAAQGALIASPIHELQKLQVEQVDNKLLISGKVNSFYHKQLAQEVVFNAVIGDVLVINSTDVHEIGK